MDSGDIVCDLCGVSVPVPFYASHFVLCQNVLARTTSVFSNQNFFVNLLFEDDILFTDQRDDMNHMNHKIVRRLTDVDRVAPRTRFSPDTCCVCLESMSNNVRRTSCGHEFCSRCIETWFEQSTTCPVCKQDFADEAGYELIDTQTMRPVAPGTPADAENNPIVSSIMRRIGTIGEILGDIEMQTR